MGIETVVGYGKDKRVVAINITCADLSVQSEIRQAVAELLTGRGYIVDRIPSWIEGQLITMSEAAKLSGRSLSSLSQLIDRGRLNVYPDLGEPNPTKRNRVMRTEVEALAKARKPAAKTKTKGRKPK